MKKLSCTLFLIVIIPFHTALAHGDYFYEKKYGNVKVSILTGFDYEEINKVFILGKLASKLAKKLNYNKPIFLYFKHHYLTEDKPEYYISSSRGKEDRQDINNNEDWQEFNHLKQEAIVLQQMGNYFDIASTLKLLEYAINNTTFIKSNQELIEYHREKTTFRYRFYSINQKPIKEQLAKKSSKLIAATQKNKIYRTENFSEREFTTGCSYYWQDNKFHLFWRSRDYNSNTNKAEFNDNHLLTLDSLYIFQEIENLDYAIFNTRKSFYYTDQHQRKISKNHIIEDAQGYYRPFKVRKIAFDKVSLSMEKMMWSQNETARTLIYLTRKDKLIQDLDERLAE